VAVIERKTGSALWLQLGEALAAEIAGGQLPPGGKLPTEPELMKRFGVSRFTVRQALGHLETRGLVRAEQGRGTFVHKRVLDYAISSRTRFSRNLIEQGFEPGGELLLHEEIPAPDRVADRLKIADGTIVIHRRGIMTADGTPVELGDSYYPAKRFPGFEEARRTLPTITAALASYGIDDYARVSTSLEARMPTSEEARLLRQPKSVPILVVDKVDADRDGVPFCFSSGVWSAERVTFTLNPSVSPAGTGPDDRLSTTF
jgi:GntR family transcriptional regulator, phosphonate transport system regulatory protein